MKVNISLCNVREARRYIELATLDARFQEASTILEGLSQMVSTLPVDEHYDRDC